MRVQCGCVWAGERCPNDATQEDGLCDWCAGFGARTHDQLRKNPNAMIAVDGTYLGLGGRGVLHDKPLADRLGLTAAACWYSNSGRTIVFPSPSPQPEERP